jgi:hypothetical protein
MPPDIMIAVFQETACSVLPACAPSAPAAPEESCIPERSGIRSAQLCGPSTTDIINRARALLSGISDSVEHPVLTSPLPPEMGTGQSLEHIMSDSYETTTTFMPEQALLSKQRSSFDYLLAHKVVCSVFFTDFAGMTRHWEKVLKKRGTEMSGSLTVAEIEASILRKVFDTYLDEDPAVSMNEDNALPLRIALQVWREGESVPVPIPSITRVAMLLSAETMQSAHTGPWPENPLQNNEPLHLVRIHAETRTMYLQMEALLLPKDS